MSSDRPLSERRAAPAADLSGRAAIVTGASRGIGRAIADALADAGAAVALVGRRAETLEPVAAAIGARGGRAIAVQAHAGHPDAFGPVVQAAEAAFGGFDILVNNAGTCPHYGPIVTADDALWDKTMDVNVRATLRAVRACLPAFERRGGGKVVNIASVAGLMPQPSVGLYCVSKAALLMLTEVLAVELAPALVQVNAVAPGFVRTRFSQAITDEPAASEGALAVIPQRRFAEPEEIVGAVLYLAGPYSGFTTGATLVVDGGQRLAAGLPLAGAVRPPGGPAGGPADDRRL
ncbi:MAG: SDR family oxidoreductase [Anaerolineae bacterium]